MAGHRKRKGVPVDAATPTIPSTAESHHSAGTGTLDSQDTDTQISTACSSQLHPSSAQVMAPDTSASTENFGFGSALNLAKIDKLFACGVGDLVNLPQIVVVGDQSSGKSSVLEGLIKKPLPRDSGLCTRFATQIVFRRAAAAKISVSIIPEKDASSEHSSRLNAWAKSVPSLDSEAFVDIMKEVHNVMGLSEKEDASQTTKPTFSNDVLRLEISGPEQEHFSVIDIPGIFRDPREGLTTKADMVMVRNMVSSYMDNPRSVILAVIPANVDVATQEILQMAAQVDPSQDRTLGVLTKPDLVDPGAEPSIVELLEGRTRSMKLGWHIIRNPGQKQLSEKGFDRDLEEADFFRSKAPWKALDKELVGIDSLRLRLNEVLTSVVKSEFPNVTAEIKSRLSDSQKQLDGLGPERGSSSAQLAYLINIATRFQRLVSLALNANLGVDDIFESEPALRLAPAVMARLITFSSEMRIHGHMYSFLPRNVDGVDTAQHPDHELEFRDFDGSEGEFYSRELDESEIELASSELNESFYIRKEGDFEELKDILQAQDSQRFPEPSGIKEWLRGVFENHRGFELGTFNPAILTTVMKKQCSKWAVMSMACVSDAIIMVHRFIQTALKYICTNEQVCHALMNTLFEELVQSYRGAIENAELLLEVESTGRPMTLNHYFNDNLQKSRQENLVAKLKQNAFMDPNHGQVVKVDQAIHSQAMSNDDHVILEIHDILKSYYKVTRKSFVDIICKMSVMHFLLNADKGPLALLSPHFVSQLSSSKLEDIVGEAPATKRLRAHLTKDVESLQEAVRVLA